MLDDRLLGQTFQLTTSDLQGVIEFYGIWYHYLVEDTATAGDTVTIVRVTPLLLYVRKQETNLEY
ncbi:hypothetical protein [Loigolactobacillus backii]|uniref:Uncharacterized protein n=1 Tax=Loigolactobacillus backii TaxID=375175 RepID=A0A192H247_9LACO|nr:hypothetical protein [Loigolactobacillus backii]ANK60480.1 hypothetical protein AYR52_09575 [Loigolactobacillus backii]ANK62021.1 hypothetical protein AYR53_04110 [Loigolactobacillus backii]ANK65358.1 hypothetical protein AYR54_08980 [Loigolactobacillus backii]ANK67910.1 hypothetical protein AYR55_09540 [Loigolactobacillus backii]ANK68785.1 hypothetical protein AYR56_00615 [Loigolactobacillus backii]